MGDVEWTEEAREAVWRAIRDLLANGETSGPIWELANAAIGDDEIDAALAALTPHVEAMVREARAEALRDAANELARNPGARTPVAELVIENWLRDRAEGVRRG